LDSFSGEPKVFSPAAAAIKRKDKNEETTKKMNEVIKLQISNSAVSLSPESELKLGPTQSSLA